MNVVARPILIEASKLSLKDDFLQYKPRDCNGKELKKLITKAIKNKIKDFYVMNLDPSFTNNEEGIRYVKGEKPALGKSYNWWKSVAKSYMPERNSRLGCKSQYAVFLGIFIKKMMEKGCSAKKAWQAVTMDSTNLEYYWESPRVEYDEFFEYTGSHEIFGFGDLINTEKIVEKDEDEQEDGFYCVGYGSLHVYRNSLADIRHVGEHVADIEYGGEVGWVVFDAEQ